MGAEWWGGQSALHTMNLWLNSFEYLETNAIRALPVFPFFENENSNGQLEKKTIRRKVGS